MCINKSKRMFLRNNEEGIEGHANAMHGAKINLIQEKENCERRMRLKNMHIVGLTTSDFRKLTQKNRKFKKTQNARQSKPG